jgi:serine kinase of HPr protein (carbohydrate metabolism regulator)
MVRWLIFEKKARRTSTLRGYDVSPQKTSQSTGKRPDFVGVSKRNPHKRIISEVKYVKELTPKHVNQVRSYKKNWAAQKSVIIIKKTTKVPNQVREYAKNSGIKIIKKRARRKNRSSWDWF